MAAPRSKRRLWIYSSIVSSATDFNQLGSKTVVRFLGKTAGETDEPT